MRHTRWDHSLWTKNEVTGEAAGSKKITARPTQYLLIEQSTDPGRVWNVQICTMWRHKLVINLQRVSQFKASLMHHLHMQFLKLSYEIYKPWCVLFPLPSCYKCYKQSINPSICSTLVTDHLLIPLTLKRFILLFFFIPQTNFTTLFSTNLNRDLSATPRWVQSTTSMEQLVPLFHRITLNPP